MKKSPLELIHYFVTDLAVSANKEHDPEKEVKLALADLHCINEVRKIEDQRSTWRIFLRVQQDTPPEKNSPYNFRIELTGLFELDSGYPQERAERFVTANGTAILYAVAREALRSGMANGPYLPLLLPSVHFVPDEKKQSTATAGQAVPKPWLAFQLRVFDMRRAGSAPQANTKRFLIGVPKSKITELAAKPEFSNYSEDALFRRALAEAKKEITPYLINEIGNDIADDPVKLRLSLPQRVPNPDFKTSSGICYWKENAIFELR